MSLPSGYAIATGYQRMDIRAIHAFLTTAYWSEGIPFEVVDRAARHALTFGVFFHDAQVGFARVITDRATFAYLADVYVLEAHRGQGLAQALVGAVLKSPEIAGVRRMLLATRDAHSLYARFGFEGLAAPERFMQIHNPGVYGNPA